MTQKQITNAAVAEIPFISPEYSTACCFNADASLILLLAFDHFQLYGGSGVFIRDLPWLGASMEPRWSSSLRRFYYIEESRFLMSWDVDLGMAVIHEFKEYESISGYGEGDCVEDCLVLGGKRKDGGVDVFVFDCAKKEKLDSIGTDGRFNGLYLTQDREAVVCWNADTKRGITTLYDRQLAPILSHQCVCRWEGEDWLIYCNSPDASVNNNGVERIRIRDGARTPLTEFGWDGSAIHVAPTNQGWVLVETYYPLPGNDFGALWKVPLDGSGRELIVNHGSIVRGGGDYASQPKAVVSRDGRKIVYGSNMGGPVVDSYLVTLESPDTQLPLDDSGLELIKVRPGAEFVMVAREDSTFDVYERMPDGSLHRVEYPVDGVSYPFISHQGGIRMYKKK